MPKHHRLTDNLPTACVCIIEARHFATGRKSLHVLCSTYIEVSMSQSLEVRDVWVIIKQVLKYRRY